MVLLCNLMLISAIHFDVFHISSLQVPRTVSTKGCNFPQQKELSYQSIDKTAPCETDFMLASCVYLSYNRHIIKQVPVVEH